MTFPHDPKEIAVAVDRSSPVTVTGTPGEPLSRWLWLIKWLLAIPHFVLLAFLWITYAVLTVIAFFAILFTGRYPRVIFEFNRGVLRWSWRVTFYSYGVLGTDRYPPFTLGAAPDYPATLDIERPGELSRGLVLIKWWLLAIPHYILLAIFTGGGANGGDGRGREDVSVGPGAYGDYDGGGWDGGPGLIFLLVFFAAIALLFTARYPRGLFDLVMGLNRWELRVIAYATLMTDKYPPFRLDMGGTEGDAASVRGPSRPGGPWPGPAIVLAVLGAVLALAGVIMSGIYLAYSADAGLFYGETREFMASGSALVATAVVFVLGAVLLAVGLLIAARSLPEEPEPQPAAPSAPEGGTASGQDGGAGDETGGGGRPQGGG